MSGYIFYMKNLFTNAEEILDNRELVLPNTAEKPKVEACKQ